MPAGKRKKTVVCIEDDSEIIDLLRLVLQDSDVNLVGALGGLVGLETVRQLHPDLVLLDLMMPDVHGWEVYRRMKADEQLRDIPVIVVTALASRAERTFGLHVAKVDDYITKPFTPAELRRSVANVLAESEPAANAAANADK